MQYLEGRKQYSIIDTMFYISQTSMRISAQFLSHEPFCIMFSIKTLRCTTILQGQPFTDPIQILIQTRAERENRMMAFHFPALWPLLLTAFCLLCHPCAAWHRVQRAKQWAFVSFFTVRWVLQCKMLHDWLWNICCYTINVSYTIIPSVTRKIPPLDHLL